MWYTDQLVVAKGTCGPLPLDGEEQVTIGVAHRGHMLRDVFMADPGYAEWAIDEVQKRQIKQRPEENGSILRRSETVPSVLSGTRGLDGPRGTNHWLLRSTGMINSVSSTRSSCVTQIPTGASSSSAGPSDHPAPRTPGVTPSHPHHDPRMAWKDGPKPLTPLRTATYGVASSPKHFAETVVNAVVRAAYDAGKNKLPAPRTAVDAKDDSARHLTIRTWRQIRTLRESVPT